MKPLRIAIDVSPDYLLTVSEIRYVFETFLMTAGASIHFVRPKETSDIYFGSQDNSSLFQIRPNNLLRRNNIRQPKYHKIEDGICYFFFGSLPSSTQIVEKSKKCIVYNDIVLTSFYLLACLEEENLTRNKFGFHDLCQSYRWQNKLLHTPIVNQYVDLIKDSLQNQHEFLPIWKDNKVCSFALTHDVDYPEMVPWVESLRYLLRYKGTFRKSLEILMGRESFWKFDEWLNVEDKYDVNSAFYFCGFKGNLLKYFLKSPDPFYDVSTGKYLQLLMSLKKAGREIGMHSSYLAYLSRDNLQHEKNAVEEALGKEIYGNRHHYWHLNQDNPTETMKIHKEIGLFYDTSMSFEKHSGFRQGICTPFYLYCIEDQDIVPLLQLPPTLMDDHLFGHADNHSFARYQDHITSLIAVIRRHNGLFMADFHVRVLNETFFPCWKDAAEFLLQKITDDHCYQDTPFAIAKYWEERLTLLRKLSIYEECAAN